MANYQRWCIANNKDEVREYNRKQRSKSDYKLKHRLWYHRNMEKKEGERKRHL
jgi:hypothetical protein